MPDGPDKDQALDQLWRAQANDAYWHGLFGGVYLFNFRVANYANLIAAEELAEGPNAPLTVRQFDFNKDSTHEDRADRIAAQRDLEAEHRRDDARTGFAPAALQHPQHHDALRRRLSRGNPRRGAAGHAGHAGVLPRNRAIGNCATPSASRKPGSSAILLVDWYRRGAFIDHFLREDVDLIGGLPRVLRRAGRFRESALSGRSPGRAERGRDYPQPRAGMCGSAISMSRCAWRKTFTFRHGEDTIHLRLHRHQPGDACRLTCVSRSNWRPASTAGRI